MIVQNIWDIVYSNNLFTHLKINLWKLQKNDIHSFYIFFQKLERVNSLLFVMDNWFALFLVILSYAHDL